jgi:hypothetical protein
MSDETPLTLLTEFAPVPVRERRDGWQEQVQRAFIAALADCGSVEAACRYVGRTPSSAYRLRRHPEGGEFARAWQLAVDLAVHMIEDAAMDRAVNGVEVPVFAYGDKIATRRVHNETLVMFMLRSRAPERYCDGGAKALNAVDKRMLDRLKKQWRQEWEAEDLARDAEEEQETFASLDAFLDNLRGNHLANMSPAQRERQIAADAQARADKAAGWGPGMPYREFAEDAAALLPGFIAEVEADWPPLPEWAWDAPEPEPPAGPRVRTVKDDEW